MRVLLFSVGSCALASLVPIAGCSGSEFSAAHGAGTGTSGQNGSGGSSAGGSGSGNAGKVGAGGKGAGGRGVGGTGTAGTSSAGGTGTGGTVTGSGGVSAGGTTGSGGAGTGGSGGTVTQSGDCRFDHGDCDPNSRCVEVTPGGYRVCTVPYPEATSCVGGTGECCKTSDCQGGGVCYPGPLAPSCGGIISIDFNVCASDMCTSDADCGTESICVPAGTMDRKVRMCVPHSCHLDTDCTAAKGGICAPVSGGCCGGVMGLYCVYPGIGCRQNKDCPSGNCEINSSGASQCANGPAVCPL